MRTKIVAANWKMNGQKESIVPLLKEVMPSLSSNADSVCILFPPAIYLPLVSTYLEANNFKLGAQNLYPAPKGAFTGEISAPMLLDYNCNYVLVGHSERRSLFTESENFVAEKFHHAKEHGIIPVLCIGETLEEREQGITQEVLRRQLSSVVRDNSGAFDNSIIAYEPVWAIGTGKTALPEQVQATHEMIRKEISQLSEASADKISILYGGSVNEKSAPALFSMPDVDGGLIGGASLNAQQFVEIVKCIN